MGREPATSSTVLVVSPYIGHSATSSGTDRDVVSPIGMSTSLEFRKGNPRLKRSHPEESEVRGTERILLVEDDQAVRTVTEKALRRFGYEVVSADSGREALRLVDSLQGVDLLLTDIMMPGMNGVEVAARIAESCPGIRIFFMSGYADQDLIRQGLLTPGTRFLQKPFSPIELASEIRSALDDSRSGKPGEGQGSGGRGPGEDRDGV
jgi:CheY-like chemotaxis protein